MKILNRNVNKKKFKLIFRRLLPLSELALYRIYNFCCISISKILYIYEIDSRLTHLNLVPTEFEQILTVGGKTKAIQISLMFVKHFCKSILFSSIDAALASENKIQIVHFILLNVNKAYQ